MLLSKEMYDLQRRRNKRQSNDAMFEMMTSKMKINFKLLSSFMKIEL